MGEQVTSERLQDFMKALGYGVTQPASIFLVGGCTAVMIVWRDTTIDIDLKVVPENDETLKLFAKLKERLDVNIELASPDLFIPELPGWEGRSTFISQLAKVTFLHYDFCAQALAKLERGHDSNLSDVRHLFRVKKLIDPEKLRDLFSQIEHQLFKYPAINPGAFRRAIELAISEAGQQ